MLNEHDHVFVTGGLISRFFRNDKDRKLPVLQGKETTGANSIAVLRRNLFRNKKMIVVGGDFNAPASDTLNCFYTRNAGKSWKAPAKLPGGYRSSVEYVTKKEAISCGLSGVDYSFDGGKRWQQISKEGFHACRKAKTGSAIFLAGSNGKIGKILFR
jgi:hypothetical protein